LRKAYFLRVKLGSLERKLPRLGIDIFWIFWHLTHFRAISLWKKQGPFHPWSFWWGLSWQGKEELNVTNVTTKYLHHKVSGVATLGLK
jgi:hypothetical protein